MLVYFVIAAATLPSMTLVIGLFVYGGRSIKLCDNIKEGLDKTNANMSLFIQDNSLKHDYYEKQIEESKSDRKKLWDHVGKHAEEINTLKIIQAKQYSKQA